jgi:5-methylcytosine-specific restriction protein A
MPRKAKHPCAHPGCPNLVPYGERFCREHEKEERKRYERYGRDPKTKKRYGREWQLIRDRYISVHPFCEKCLLSGRIVKAEEVHHIVPLSQGGTNSYGNLMSLCKSCHSRIHASRGDRWHK